MQDVNKKGWFFCCFLNCCSVVFYTWQKQRQSQSPRYKPLVLYLKGYLSQILLLCPKDAFIFFVNRISPQISIAV